jgi:hypothetical protein
MLVGRCSSELSSHKLQAKSKKSQAPSAADLSRHAVEGSAVSINLKRIAGRAGLGATGKLRAVDAGAGLAGGADYVHQL